MEAHDFETTSYEFRRTVIGFAYKHTKQCDYYNKKKKMSANTLKHSIFWNRERRRRRRRWSRNRKWKVVAGFLGDFNAGRARLRCAAKQRTTTQMQCIWAQKWGFHVIFSHLMNTRNRLLFFFFSFWSGLFGCWGNLWVVSLVWLVHCIYTV